MATKREKKVDYEALNSAFMKIPRMKVEVARDLLELGFTQVYELSGRAPDNLFQELKKKNENAPDDRLGYFRMATYFAENPDPDPSLMHPSTWQER